MLTLSGTGPHLHVPMAHPPLFDLAVLYRALAFGADRDLDPAEVGAMREALRAWAPGEDPARVDHALREAALVEVGPGAVGEVAARVGAGLDGPGRARVLADLRRVAGADGRVTAGERDLLALVERTLEA